MLPIRDHNPSGKFPFFTYLLIAANVLVFFYLFSLPELSANEFIGRYALVPADVVQNKNLQTLITAMFLHASLGHIFGNMLFLPMSAASSG